VENLKLTPFQPSGFATFISWLDNEELLFQIAGRYFTFPLTDDQLRNYLADGKSIAFNVLALDKIVGHAEIILLGDGRVKLDKIIIGDPSMRGKGLGGQLIEALLNYAFSGLQATGVELLVFDWNMAGIKCYEKAGFTFVEQEMPPMEVGGKRWGVKKMQIDKSQFCQHSQSDTKFPF
jgi:RimJ/RimL family protein N-acetyltransferase